MKFVLDHFSQKETIRQYIFQSIAEGGKRAEVAVSVDLNLFHKYGITLQEGPLLCSLLLARAPQGESSNLVFTEDDMILHAQQRSKERAEEAARKSHRAPAEADAPAEKESPMASLLSATPNPNRKNIGLGSSYLPNP